MNGKPTQGRSICREIWRYRCLRSRQGSKGWVDCAGWGNVFSGLQRGQLGVTLEVGRGGGEGEEMRREIGILSWDDVEDED